MAVFTYVVLATFFGFVVFTPNVQGGKSNFADCPNGWLLHGPSRSCLWASRDVYSSLLEPSKDCEEKKNATLIKIDSEGKFQFFKDIVKEYFSSNDAVLIPLVERNGVYEWKITANFTAKAGYIPTALKVRPNRAMRCTEYGMRYSNSGEVGFQSCYNSAINYICEKKARCKDGRFGNTCDKECHCYGETCDPLATDDDVMCSFGCKLGWTGQGCNIRKEPADVNFFCIKSDLEGDAALVRIDTKGFNYGSISAKNRFDDYKGWCHDTTIENHPESNATSLMIRLTDVTVDRMGEGFCPGKMRGYRDFEWQIYLQETDGLVSRNDQEVIVRCNFASANKSLLSTDVKIKNETWHKPTSLMRAVQTLHEKKEKLSIEIVDPKTGKILQSPKIGTSVVLQIRYGLTKDSLLTGVVPFNCHCEYGYNEKKPLIDSDGCPYSPELPMSAFFRNGTNSVITEPFPLFGVPGQKEFKLDCSYRFCFGNDPCPVGCNQH